MRFVFAFLLASVLIACGEAAPAPEPDAARPDARPDDPGLHCDSVIRWCEDGKIFEGFTRYPACTDIPAVCTRAEAPLDFIQAVHICPSGCATFDGGTACLFFDWHGEELHPQEFCAP